MSKPLDTARLAGRATSGAILRTAGAFGSVLRGVGRTAWRPIASVSSRSPIDRPGAAPGIEHLLASAPDQAPERVARVDYGPECHESRDNLSLDEALDEARPAGATIRWVNVDGPGPAAMDAICRRFGVHALSAEDLLNPLQRPKFEAFDDYLLVLVRQARLASDRLKNEQTGILCFGDLLITIQEEPGDVFDPVRRRIENASSRFRRSGPEYLLYALVDCIVDHLFPILESYGAAMEDLEEAILRSAGPPEQQRLFALKHDLSVQRRLLWPTREVLDGLIRSDSPLLGPDVKTYLRDVHDHAMQLLDIVETYRETASGLGDLYQSVVSNRMNETMKVLTLMASFFIPITFLAGVYGMNFEHIPELGWSFAYPAFWGVCFAVTAFLAWFFRRKGWLGGGR